MNTALLDRQEIASGNLTEEQEIYKENILDHYKHPRNKREMPACTICQHNVNPLCGDQITLYLDIEEGRLRMLTFTGQGCAISQAAASILTEEVQGKPLAKVWKFTTEDMLALLGIPVSAVRRKCALLAWSTLQEGIACLK